MKVISLIFTPSFPKELKFKSNDFFSIIDVKDDKSAFKKLEENITKNNIFYNVILSGHKTIEDGYGLLKYFLDDNFEKNYIDSNSNIPFFIFIESEKFDKKKLISYYLKKEKDRNDLEDRLKIDSKLILFSNVEYNVEERLNHVLNYYHKMNLSVHNKPFNYSFIKIMYIGFTGSGKSSLLNELNGEKLSYSSSENILKTRQTLLFKNRKYPILNQDTEGFEIADETQVEKVKASINKNYGYIFNERLHIVILLMKDERGLDNNDIALLVKLHEMRILYYAFWPRNDGKDISFRRRAHNQIKELIVKIKNNTIENDIYNLFEEFIKNKEKLITTLEEIGKRVDKIIFSGNIFSKVSKGKKNLLNQMKNDLLEIYNIHKEYINKIKEYDSNKQQLKIDISGKVIEGIENNCYYKMLNASPFFSKFSIDEIRKKQAEELIKEFNVNPLWLIFYNKRVEDFRKDILQKLKNIYSDVKIDTEIETNEFNNEESWFYKTKFSKLFFDKLLKIFSDKYKEMELNDKYLHACQEYNMAIKEFEKYVDEFCNAKLNKEPILYDLDLI